MKVACLCPTFRRPALLPTAIAQFLSQLGCEGHELRLFVLDDDGQYDSQCHGRWELLSRSERSETMGSKHNALVRWAAAWGAEVCCQWDDDDVYLPRHVASHLTALSRHSAAQWSIPIAKYVEMADRLSIERHVVPWCHGSWAYRLSAWLEIGGYDEQPRDDFDLDFGLRLLARYGPAADVSEAGDLCYVYRWGTSGSRNVSSFARDGSTYYHEARNNGDATPQHGRPIVPALDPGAQRLWNRLLDGQHTFDSISRSRFS